MSFVILTIYQPIEYLIFNGVPTREKWPKFCTRVGRFNFAKFSILFTHAIYHWKALGELRIFVFVRWPNVA